MAKYDEIPDGEFLKEAGEFIATVTGHKKEISKSGKPCVDFHLRTESGNTIRYRVFTTAAAQWKFKEFAAACVLTDADKQVWDSDYEDTWHVFNNKRLIITVTQEGQYYNVTGVRQMEDGFEDRVPEPKPEAQNPYGEETNNAEPQGEPKTDDDLPF